MTETDERMIKALVDLALRPGSALERLDRESVKTRIKWEWLSKQWVMTTDINGLTGWQSWYYVTKEILAFIKEHPAQVPEGKTADEVLTRGDYLYVGSTITAPGAPKGTYFNLFKLTSLANPDVRSISAHMAKRNGRVVFHTRRPWDGMEAVA